MYEKEKTERVWEDKVYLSLGLACKAFGECRQTLSPVAASETESHCALVNQTLVATGVQMPRPDPIHHSPLFFHCRSLSLLH